MKKFKNNVESLIKFSLSSKTALILFTEILLGLTLLLFSIFIFADITKDTLIDREVVKFDTEVSQSIYSYRTPVVTEVMKFISLMGADFMIACATVILIILTFKKHKRESLIFSLIFILGAGLNLLLKEIFQRPRPNIDPLLTLTSYSFPSGHAMNSFIFYAVISYFTFHFTRSIKVTFLVGVVSAILVSLIGVSRVYLGVHYPSDVIAGFAAGLLWFVLVLLIERTIIFLKLFKNYRGKKLR